MQHRKRLNLLLDKYTANAITEEERTELFQLIASGDYDDLLEEHFTLKFYEKEHSGADMPAERAHSLLQKILVAEKQNALLLPQNSQFKPALRSGIAAAVMAFVLLTIFLVWQTGFLHFSTAADSQFASGMREEANRSSGAMQLWLEDSSLISLQPGSVLRYPVHFKAGKREVFLQGEAFFSVSKHPGQPFLVYCNNTVTHVLGTSFNVRPDKQKKLVEVSVRTGRVQVYEGNEMDFTRKKINGVILTPNQQVIYREEERQFTTTIVNNPLPLVKEALQQPDATPSFVFEDTPFRSVIDSLEKTYGIQMIIENESMYNCLFTGDISRQNLYAKLDILCQSVKASYQIAGTSILIEGKGCY